MVIKHNSQEMNGEDDVEERKYTQTLAIPMELAFNSVWPWLVLSPLSQIP